MPAVEDRLMELERNLDTLRATVEIANGMRDDLEEKVKKLQKVNDKLEEELKELKEKEKKDR